MKSEIIVDASLARKAVPAALTESGRASCARRVLVLDDEIDVARTIAAQVSALGHEARAVTDHEAFCRELSAFRPEILIIDTCMPGHDALDVVRDLKATSETQIIVTSGFGRRMIETVVHSARHYGHDVLGALPKPIRRKALDGLLKQALVRAAPQPPRTAPDGAPPAPPAPTAAELGDALQRKEFLAYFQPKRCLKTNSICGFEALVRWSHPRHGVLSPAAFLPQILEHGLEADLTFQMLDQACDFLAKLPHPGLRVAINCSLATVQLPEFRKRLDAAVLRHRLIPGRLIIEVTESGNAELPQHAIETLVRLRMAGYELSIDDFGTGVSSLMRLVRVPFAELKIDRSFVDGLSKSDEAQDIVASLVTLGRTLDMYVSVEGIEDAATLDRITALGCDVAQGYFIGRPMPADAAARMYLEASGA